MQKQRAVLIIDDDAAIRHLLVTVLMKEGFLVDTTRNGEEAIEKISISDYDAILLDLRMPRVDGFEVLDYLARAAPGMARNAVIVLTAVSDKDLGNRLASTVYRVLRKPFDLSVLVALVHECAGGAK